MIERRIIQRTLKNPVQKINIKYNTFKNNIKNYGVMSKSMNNGNMKINSTFSNQRQLNRKNVPILQKARRSGVKGVAVEQTMNNSLTPVTGEEIKVNNIRTKTYFTNRNKTLRRTNYVNPITGGFTRKVKVRGLPKYRRVSKQITY